MKKDKLYKIEMIKKIMNWTLSVLMFVSLCVNQISVLQATDEYIDLASDAAIQVSSTNGDNRAEYMTDGNLATQWVSMNSTNETVVFDLKKKQAIDIVKITWGVDFAFKYKVQVSDDNVSYKDMIYHEEGTGGSDEWPMAEGTAARYVRIKVEQANTGSTRVSIKEVNILQMKQTEPEGALNIALNKDAYASGIEAGLARLGPKGAFDGDLEDMTNGRWSSGNIKTSPQWIYVDLGKESAFSSIHILWEKAHGTSYALQYSNTAKDDDWKTFVNVTNGDGDWDKHSFESFSARYIRLYITAGVGMGQAGAVSVMEMQVFEETQSNVTIDDIAADFTIPALSPTDTHMPTMSYEEGQFTAEIFCSDTDFVVEDSGEIHKPLVDKKVLVTYLIKDTKSKEEKEMRNIPVTIPGIHRKDASKNAIPVTVPTLQEWYGVEGIYQFSKDTTIIYQDETLKEAAEITKADIKNLFGVDVKIADSGEKAGDIILTFEEGDTSIGKQGYTLDVQDKVWIRGTDYQGVFFGTRSVLQALQANETTMQINQGNARDYPNYAHRKFMLDVARKYAPMWYLEDFVKYASWFKFSEIQIHLNDTSYNAHSRFRLESNIKGLTATDGYYTKAEYRNFQSYADQYGIDIISEFDTPAHSAVFNDIKPELKFDANHLDIRLDSPKKDTVYQFIADLYEEYLGGDDPVFTSDYFNVGLDEYNSNYKEDMTQYTKYVSELVHDKYGKTPMAWASMGCLNSSTTTLPTYPVMDAWANYAISLKDLFKQGYSLINATNKYGYVVPGGNNGYPDFAKTEEIYNNFSAGKFRDKNNAGIDVAEGHPQIVGGSISLWNDRGIFNGISTYDVFKRQQSIMPVYAQKFWYGNDETKDYQTFDKDVKTVGIGPSNTLDHDIKSKSEKVYDIDFENAVENGEEISVQDTSSNQFDVRVTNGDIVDGSDGKALAFQGNTTLSLQQPALSYPYTVSFDLNIKTYGDEDINLFQQQMPKVACDETIDTGDQISRIFVDKATHKLTYKRDHYTFIFDYVVPLDTNVKLAMTCNQKTSKLYANGKLVASLNGPLLTNSGSKWQDSATIYLPLETIGENLVGQMDNLKVFNRELDSGEIADVQGMAEIENLALNKVTKASSQYNASQGPEKAVDGIEDMSSRWASARTHDQWMQVDLGDVYKVNKIYMNWEDAFGKEFKLLGSLDGTTWFEIKHVSDGKKGVSIYDDLGQVSTRFIKVQGIVAANNAKYGYSLLEMMVYEKTNDELLRLLKTMEEKLKTLDVGDKTGQINESVYLAYASQLEDWKSTATTSKTLSAEELITIKTLVQKGYRNVEKAIVNVDTSKLEKAIQEKEALQENSYIKDSWKVLQDTLVEANALLVQEGIGQKAVDAMIKKLTEIELITRGNTDELKTYVDQQKGLVKSNYTLESWTVFAKAMEDAEALVKDNSNATQADVDALYSTVTKARNALVFDTTVAKTILKSAIDKAVAAEASKEFKTLAVSVQALITRTRAAAQVVYGDASATREQCIDAWLALANALQFLDFQANKIALLALINECEAMDTNAYQEGVVEFEAALANAQRVYEDQNMLQDSIDQAYDRLEKAKLGLVKKDVVDKSLLELMIRKITEQVGDGSQYQQNEAYTAFLNALAEANAVVLNEDVTQVDVNEAMKNLSDTYINIRLKPSEEQLAQLTGFLQVVKNLNRTLYAKEQLEIIDAATAKVNALMKNFDERKFDAVQKEMNVAYDIILHGANTDTPSKPEGDNPTSNQGSPKTGDTTAITGCILAFVLSSCLAVILMKKRNRKFDHKA